MISQVILRGLHFIKNPTSEITKFLFLTRQKFPFRKFLFCFNFNAISIKSSLVLIAFDGKKHPERALCNDKGNSSPQFAVSSRAVNSKDPAVSFQSPVNRVGGHNEVYWTIQGCAQQLKTHLSRWSRTKFSERLSQPLKENSLPKPRNYIKSFCSVCRTSWRSLPGVI